MVRGLILALTALALSAAACATTINVSFSEEFAEKLEDEYGVREGERLSEEIIEDIQRELEKAGVEAAQIDVTILDAKPNRPTLEQVSDRPGLDPFRSISIGGMSLVGSVHHLDGVTVTEVEYKWYENDIRQSVGTGTWWDANRVSRRFAQRVADAIAGQ